MISKKDRDEVRKRYDRYLAIRHIDDNHRHELVSGLDIILSGHDLPVEDDHLLRERIDFDAFLEPEAKDTKVRKIKIFFALTNNGHDYNLSTYGDLIRYVNDKMKKLNPERTLARLPGIGPKYAKCIYEHLKKKGLDKYFKHESHAHSGNAGHDFDI